MKTYKVKNYKGNIVESLKKFQEKYPDIKISKASVEDNSLKIVGEKKEKKFEISYSYKVDNKGPEKKDKTTITAGDRRTAKEKFFNNINDNYAVLDFEIKEVV